MEVGTDGSWDNRVQKFFAFSRYIKKVVPRGGKFYTENGRKKTPAQMATWECLKPRGWPSAAPFFFIHILPRSAENLKMGVAKTQNPLRDRAVRDAGLRAFLPPI